MSSGTGSEYNTESSSDELDDCDRESNEEVAGKPLLEYPYPFFGRPYVTKSILNTIDAKLLSSIVREISLCKVKCLQFEKGHGQKKYSLGHILFGDGAVSFSKVAG